MDLSYELDNLIYKYECLQHKYDGYICKHCNVLIKGIGCHHVSALMIKEYKEEKSKLIKAIEEFYKEQAEKTSQDL